jgi:hypothetical protein
VHRPDPETQIANLVNEAAERIARRIGAGNATDEAIRGELRRLLNSVAEARMFEDWSPPS